MKLQLLLVLVISIFLSCGKSSDSSSAKLKKVSTNNVYYTEYEYNNDGKVSRLSGTGSSDSHGYSDVSYSDGRISGITEYISNRGADMAKSSGKTLQYDAANRLTAILIKHEGVPLLANSTYHFRYDFSYTDGSDRFSSCIQSGLTETGDDPRVKYEFKYDGRGNVIEESLFFRENNGWKRDSRKLFEYKQVPNPLYQLGDPISFSDNHSKDYWVKYSRVDSENPVFNTSISRSYKLQGGKIISAASLDGIIKFTYEYY